MARLAQQEGSEPAKFRDAELLDEETAEAEGVASPHPPVQLTQHQPGEASMGTAVSMTIV